MFILYIALLILNVKPVLLCFCDVTETFFKLFFHDYLKPVISANVQHGVKTAIPIAE